MKIEKVTGSFGGRATGLDVSKPLTVEQVETLEAALDDHGVLFFPHQPVLTAEEQLALAAQFGTIETPPLLTKQSEHPQVLIVEFEKPKGSGADVWHQDGTHLEVPPKGTFLQAHVLPGFGGDTCFACMYSAYEALSSPMRDMLDGLSVLHSTQALYSKTLSRGQYDPETARIKPPVSHPLVTANPRSGRKRLFVNPLYALQVEGISEGESRYLLNFLFDHLNQPEFQLRHHWSVGDIAYWDNMAVQHYAVADYVERRRMQRVTLVGEAPSAVGDDRGRKAA